MSHELRNFIRLVIESAPSKLTLGKRPFLSADSTGYEASSHLYSSIPRGVKEAEPPLAPHLRWAEEFESDDAEQEDEHGPVPPQDEYVRISPDPYTRGQYDNVTWQR